MSLEKDEGLADKHDVILCVLFTLPDVNLRDEADHHNSCESFHSCRSVAGTEREDSSGGSWASLFN